MNRLFKVFYKPYADVVGELEVVVCANNADDAKEKIKKRGLIHITESNNSGYVSKVEDLCIDVLA